MRLGFQGKAVAEASEQMQNLYQLFLDVDATQVEINPFGLTPQNKGACSWARIRVQYMICQFNERIKTNLCFHLPSMLIVVCFDAKISFDDNAIFKHPELRAMRDTTEENPREVEAEDCGLNYVGMDGNIGCLGKHLSVVTNTFNTSFVVIAIVLAFKPKFSLFVLLLCDSEWSRAGVGNDGHHQAARCITGQLFGCWRRSDDQAGRAGV